MEQNENKTEPDENKTEPKAYVLKARRRWPKRVVKLLLLVVTVWWISHARDISRNRDSLEDEVERLWRRGEPMRAADFEARGIADEDNAALLLRAAVRSIEPSAACEQLRRLEVRSPLDRGEMALIEQVLEENGDVLAKVRQARAMKHASWPLPQGDSMRDIRLEDFREQRMLAEILRAGIYLRHRQGNDEQAVELMRDLLGLIRALHVAPGGLGEQEAAVNMSSKLMEIVFEMTPQLAIGGSARNVQGEELRKLIVDLLDEKAMWEGARRAVQWERATALEMARAAGRGEYGYSAADGLAQSVLTIDRYLSRPEILNDAKVWSEHQTRMLCVMNLSDDLPGFENMTRRATVETSQLHWMGRPTEDLVRPLYCRVTERRLGAVMLALAWYSAEHEGRRPRELAELVPNYLPAVPKDPFFAGGRPIGYRWEKRPAIYGVGHNGTDEGGSEKSSVYTVIDRWQREDVVVRLEVQEWEKIWAQGESRAIVK